MFRKISNHLIAPKLALAAASSAAAKVGLKVFPVVGSNMAPTLEAGQIAWYSPLTSPLGLTRASVVALRAEAFGGVLVPTNTVPGLEFQHLLPADSLDGVLHSDDPDSRELPQPSKSSSPLTIKWK